MVCCGPNAATDLSKEGTSGTDALSFHRCGKLRLRVTVNLNTVLKSEAALNPDRSGWQHCGTGRGAGLLSISVSSLAGGDNAIPPKTHLRYK